MISVRHAPGARLNPELKEVRSEAKESNSAWLRRVGATRGILLLGGTSLAHFRLRVSQSDLRSDLFPSFWSLAGILDEDATKVHTVPLDWRGDASNVPGMNGVQTHLLRDYDDPTYFPNVAVLQFTHDDRPILEAVGRIRAERSIVDLPRLMVAWLGYVWGSGQSGNPLVDGLGIPSAAFVESAHAMAGIELTPGLSSDASCPEAIWQSGKWWRGYYEETGALGREGQRRAVTPKGWFALRQRAAAVYDPEDVAAMRGTPGPAPRAPRGRGRSTPKGVRGKGRRGTR
jgi:hypothetical protein